MGHAQKKSTNRLSKLFNNGSTPNLLAPLPTERRVVSLQQPYPVDRQNAPWVPPPPPPPHQRAASAQIPSVHLPAPIDTSDRLLRKPIPNPSDRRAVSASSSPITGLYPVRSNGSANSAWAPPVQAPSPHTLAVPGLPSPTTSTATTSKRDNKRKSWFGGSGTKLSKPGKEEVLKSPPSWILGHGDARPAYDTTALLGAYQVNELWNPVGDVFVYLFPRTSGHGPSFCVSSTIFSSSTVLTEMAFGKLYSYSGVGQSTAALSQAGRRQVSTDSSTRRPYSRGDANASNSSASQTDPSEDSLDSRNLEDDESGHIHLQLPIALSADGGGAGSGATKLSSNDIDTLISARNLFAFLIGQSIIATERRPSIFSVFLKIADFLNSYGFSNLDGSTFGEVAHGSFDAYIDELRLGDVRGSRSATIEAIVLGEKMRSVILYNEAFVHGVGKWYDIVELKDPKFDMISRKTQTRMERAALDLDQRKRNINAKLGDFDFPAIFSGIMNSKTADESKQVKFEEWRMAFNSTRKWFMSYYRSKYGSWPPKASSKKNTLETSGLNRIVLKDLYQDLGNLYDLLVDRQSLTTRTTDMIIEDDDTEDADGPMQRALRKVLNEYDRSTPPVQPPIPFDTPLIPQLILSGNASADKKLTAKKLKKENLNEVLKASYNQSANISTPFMDSFKEYEHHEAHNSTIRHLGDLRQGQWLFLYAIIQSLPMLVVDAPAVKWTHGVEYFLCEPPRSGVPWAKEMNTAYTYYAVAGGGGVVSLPSDIIEFGVEGIYRRSHCWIKAEEWTKHSSMLSAAVEETLHRPDNLDNEGCLDPLDPPPQFGAPGALSLTPRSRSSSPGSEGGRSKRRSIMLSGLEALPMPGSNGFGPGGFASMGSQPGSPILSPRPGSSRLMTPAGPGDPTKTFDAILGSMQSTTSDKKKKGKK
ncbi:hypothetical protein BLS_001362 [Venturia inaequalis]|uniref:DUF8004 domain-containing protein n=1 Tax=Venturia inaequalis TaxID=5025 RepID=A0A8H3Z486_VENIN|nr:hypothetical protein EG327_008169 [Venturia inaequalis]KAE9984789.1 hypothetical protein BLS_001362 [Venturia inaequalis]RDI82968.1 hypothetical protein Vi05172_g7006 [Venturia inaequalis]